MESWRPVADLDTLRARARLYARIRGFFEARGVLEVETPILSRHATVDRHIDSFATLDGRWLHTSPEFAMKRLLAAGSGPIYQIARVFRRDEQGRHHNPEFTMLEWYRPGYDHHALMDEVEALLRTCDGPQRCGRSSYAEVFERHAGFDPHRLPVPELRSRLAAAGVAEPEGVTDTEAQDRDFWLDLWMAAVVGPRLGVGAPVFVYDFPASQAVLARVREGTPPVAERFELFWQGLELANGFHELTDAGEQQRRFEADQRWRAAHGRSVPPYDRELVAALEAGLPPSAGVALGLDRLLMLLLKLERLDATLGFPADRA